MNKKIILLILVLCMSVVFAGCQNTPKVPEDFDKDLWKDSVETLRIIYSTYEKDNNFSVKDENAIEEYFNTCENRQYDNIEENNLIYSIEELYKNYKTYLFSKKANLKTKILDKESCEDIFKELKSNYKNIIK